VEWHLGAPVVAAIPFDHGALQRAIAEQRALVLDPSSRAGRALIGLAEGMHEGKLRVPAPAEAAGGRVRWWRRIVGHKRPPSATRPIPRIDHSPVVAMSETRGRAW
jgi:hypothetical protein